MPSSSQYFYFLAFISLHYYLILSISNQMIYMHISLVRAEKMVYHSQIASIDNIFILYTLKPFTSAGGLTTLFQVTER